MKLSYYKKIIEKYREIKKRDCIEEMALSFPDVPFSTLASIISQEYQRKVKRTYHIITTPQKIAQYYQRYLKKVGDRSKECGFLLRLADEVDLSPALMAKQILEYHYKINCSSKDPEDKETVGKNKIAELLKNPSLIQDKHLAAEIKMCVLSDEHYGAISDLIRNTVGLEHEIKLKEELDKFGFSFIDEKQLREKGYDKTPDVKLDIPIVVDGHVVNWIESKASFGDEDRHKEYLKDQYWSYCNRFGPGLVIYWSGYIEELNSYKEQGIIISDSLPTQATYMDPSLLIKKTYVDKIL